MIKNDKNKFRFNLIYIIFNQYPVTNIPFLFFISTILKILSCDYVKINFHNTLYNLCFTINNYFNII